MTQAPPLICPRCGATMNHHAEKLVMAAGAEPDVDPELGGYIQELHGCPGCGHLESRRATSTPAAASSAATPPGGP